MKKITKKYLFITALLFCFVLPPMTALGADVSVTGKSVAQIQSEIQSAIAGGGTVTVTGAKTDANATLTLNTTAASTIVWRAFYSGTPAGDGPLITLSGTGLITFRVETGGWVENTGIGITINTTVDNKNIDVYGGTIAANSGNAIYANGANNVVTVDSGTIYNKSEYNVRPAVRLANTGNILENVIVKGTGSVSVRAGNGNGFAIETYGNVTVSDDATVYVNGAGRAINALGDNSQVTVSGNSTVYTKTGIAIRTSAADAKVTVIGNALVYNEGTSNTYPVIWMENGSTATPASVIISDDVRVEARGVGGTAIRTNGAVEVNSGAVSVTDPASRGNAINANSVTVSGGVVSAKTGYAINTTNATTVSGGFVFAYGTPATDVVHSLPVFALPADTGIVVAWARPAGQPPFTYELPAQSQDHLHVFTVGGVTATVKWTGGGISYQINGPPVVNKGFFPVPEVTVISKEATSLFFIFSATDPTSGDFRLNNAPYLDQPGNWEYDNNTLTLKGFTWNDHRDNMPTALTILCFDDSNQPTPGNLTIKLEGENSFTADGKEQSHSFGIVSVSVNLTIEGDGTLYAAGSSDTSGKGVTLGIEVVFGNLTINGGTVIAEGMNEKTGGAGIFVAAGDIKINGGTVTAIGDGPPGSESSIGIVAEGLTDKVGGKIEINGGTVTTQGPEQAIFVGYAPDETTNPILDPSYFSLTDEAYIHWENTIDVDPGGKGTLVYPGSGTSRFNYSEEDEYVKIVATLFAITDEKTIGDAVTKPSDGQKGTITLFGDKVNTDGITNLDVTDWFIGVPPGVTVRADANPSAETINVTFIVPKPAEVVDDPGADKDNDPPADPTLDPTRTVTIVIPPRVVTGNDPIVVLPNPGRSSDCGGGCDSGAVNAGAGFITLLFLAGLRTGGLLKRRKKADK